MSFGQSDCSVFKLAISQEYHGQSAWFFPCRYRMEEDKSWFEHADIFPRNVKDGL